MTAPRTPAALARRATFVLLAFALGAMACGSEFVGNLNPSTVPCQVSASTPVQSVAATGGSGSLLVTALPECAWKITLSSNWISGVTPASGQGEQQVTFAVAANPTEQARQGAIVINAFEITVRQEAAAAPPPPPPPATDTVAPTVTLAVPATTVPVNQAVALTATATDNVGVTRVEFYANSVLISSDTTAPYTASWTPTQAATVGLRTEGVDAAGNRGVSAQVNVTVTATAPPPSCTYTLAATSATVTAAGGALTVGLTTGTSCTWTVQAQVSWITVTSSATGVGPTVVAMTVAPNTGAARTGTVSIANQTFTVAQATATVCTYDIKPDRISNVSENGATGLTTNVSTAADCAWTAVSNASWITVTAGAAGAGPGVVTFSVAANPGNNRTGTITIGGRTLRVDQDDDD